MPFVRFAIVAFHDSQIFKCVFYHGRLFSSLLSLISLMLYYQLLFAHIDHVYMHWLKLDLIGVNMLRSLYDCLCFLVLLHVLVFAFKIALDNKYISAFVMSCSVKKCCGFRTVILHSLCLYCICSRVLLASCGCNTVIWHCMFRDRKDIRPIKGQLFSNVLVHNKWKKPEGESS